MPISNFDAAHFFQRKKAPEYFSPSQVLYPARPILGGHQLAPSAPDLVIALDPSMLLG